ncbi:MAG TPA: DinB family protein [Fimbriimonas sp.]|nr:DinB family protein [Fimbriimonas sp.]
MDVTEALLDSWDRQCRIVSKVASLVNESNRHLKPCEDGWPLDRQLAHIHSVRHFFLKNIDPDRGNAIESSFTDGWQTPISDLDKIKALLDQSGPAARDAVADALQKNGVQKIGWYDNPVLYLQHMVWHEGWHVGQIFTALRLGGQEVQEEWEEPNVWGEWRTEEWD